MSIFEFSAKDAKGQEASLGQFKGKFTLIVNTASECGFTPQYKELQEIYERRKDDLTVLAFPCNQFGKQEPASDREIAQFCELNFKTTFPLFAKVQVNGKNVHPLFQYLKTSLPGVMGTKKIKWNFTKFLIDREGEPIKRYSPTTTPLQIEKDLEKLL